MASAWLRLEARAAWVGWTSELPSEQYAAYVKLLQSIKVHGKRGGRIQKSYFTDRVLGYLNLSRNAFEEMLKRGISGDQAGGAIEIINGEIRVKSWNKYQIDPTGAARVARHRGKDVTDVTGVTVGNGCNDDGTGRDGTGEPPIVPHESDLPEGVGDAGFLNRPVSTDAEFAQARGHVLGCYRDAFATDSNIPPIPKLDEWLERVFREAGSGRAGLAYIRTIAREDFLTAANAFYGRPNKKALWSGTWVQNARNSRTAEAQEARAVDAKRQEAEDAKDCHVADEIARKHHIDAQARAIDAAWEKLPVVKRRERMAATKAKHGFLTGKGLERAAKQAYAKEQADVSRKP